MLEGIRMHLERNTARPLLALGVAGWMRYVSGTDEQGNAIDVRDPLSDKFQAIVATSSDAERVSALLTLNEIFGDDLPQNPVFVEAITSAYQRLVRLGARRGRYRNVKNLTIIAFKANGFMLRSPSLFSMPDFFVRMIDSCYYITIIYRSARDQNQPDHRFSRQR